MLKDVPDYCTRSSNDLYDDKYYSIIDGIKYRNSAVLIPLIENVEGTRIILTIRSKDLTSHAGQISFPGGKVDTEDNNPVDTAYREAFEEIGLSKNQIVNLGYLDPTTTGTNYIILPVVALVHEDFKPRINKGEVEDIIYLPLDFIRDKNNLKFIDKDFDGTRKSFYLYQYKEYAIWGATARILKSMSEGFFQ